MNAYFDHLFFSSFKEKLDHEILYKLSAYTNKSVSLFTDESDDRLSGYDILASGPKQWVYDSSIAGATIADSSTIVGDWANCRVDYTNGRLIKNASPNSSPSSINVALKHFNSYITSKSDEELFNNVYFDAPPEMTAQTSALKADSYYAPCYFIKMGKTTNEGFELGGKDKTEVHVKVTIFTRSEFELYGVGGVFRDMKNKATYMLDSTPLDEFMDLKSRPWSFIDKMGEMRDAGQPKIYIEDVDVSPIKSEAINNKLFGMNIGLATFKCFVVRNSRQ